MLERGDGNGGGTAFAVLTVSPMYPPLPAPIEHQAVAAAPESGPCPRPCAASGSNDCPLPDLSGRRVLYVGGRNRQVAHFRALVERHRGEFLHHDGGLSESTARLTAMIESADAVLCPVDCVSHDACQRIKRLCKRVAKRFVPLRSASLASFQEGLRALGA